MHEENEPRLAAMQELGRCVGEVKPLVDSLRSKLAGVEITEKLAAQLRSFADRYETFFTKMGSFQSYDEAALVANQVANYGKLIATGVSQMSLEDTEVESLTMRLREGVARLKRLLDQRKPVLQALRDRTIREVRVVPTATTIQNQRKEMEERINILSKALVTIETERIRELEKIQENIKKLELQTESLSERTNAFVAELSTSLEKEVEAITLQFASKLEEVKSLFDSSKATLEVKKKEVDDLVGTIAGGVIAGDYEKSAAAEKRNADYLRYGSLFCMAAIGIMVGYSFYETTIDAFKWENSIFRLVFSILLSIPAAYVARESAKHRLQQYSHLQTSLDLKAITPYLASLPEAERHRLKAEIASKLFGTREFNHSPAEPYPLNPQELLLALVNKVETLAGEKKK